MGLYRLWGGAATLALLMASAGWATNANAQDATDALETLISQLEAELNRLKLQISTARPQTVAPVAIYSLLSGLDLDSELTFKKKEYRMAFRAT